MVEATVLYSVTGVVVVGLVIWVAVVLATAKHRWSRPAPARALAPDVELEPAYQTGSADALIPPGGAPNADAEETAKATPFALGEARASATSEAANDRSGGSGSKL